ncbi:flagellar filament capping protein FliD [Curtobacterium sp. RRHDQ10]|uniref:flagellar filament capping protein FliD n=1 Tax=Curtobacterium phyllosphaerae TaxID=3413379 RepID=UPI003BF0B53F
MSLAIDGLASGLDTTSLINSLMTIEQQPQTLLKSKVTTTQSFISSLQTINGQIQNLATKATTAAAKTSLNLWTASSSAPSVSATATVSATPGAISFTVGSTAAAQIGVTAAMSTWPANADGTTAPAITLVAADGTKTAVTAASTSLDDVASAINGSAAGVKAVKVASGTASDGTKQYRLQLTSTTTGAAGAFSVYQGTADQVDAGTATNVLAEPGAGIVTKASDAAVTLWAGTDAQQTITSKSNSFTDLLPGLNITVSATSTDPVTVTVGRNTTAAAAVASGLVDQFNAITSYYGTATAVTTSTDSTTGATTTTSGTLTGDATTRSAMQRLSSAMSTPVNGKSPSSIGMSINKDGTFTFDSNAFQTALAADPAGVQSMLSGIAQNVADAANAMSDKYTGSITTAITGQQSVVTDLSKQISDWDDRLAARKASLQAVYTNLETSLSTLKSQSSWLTSALSGLSTSSS